MTIEEKKEIERVFQKPIHEVEETDIPAYIRERDFEAEEDEKYDYHPRPEEEN